MIPQFEFFPPSKIRYLTTVLKEETIIRGCHLYIEGEPCTKVFLVKKGQFKVTKKLVEVGDGKFEAVSHHRNAGNTLPPH